MNIVKKTAVFLLTVGLLCTQAEYPALVLAQESDYESNDTLENDTGEQESPHEGMAEEESSLHNDTGTEDDSDAGAATAPQAMDAPEVISVQDAEEEANTEDTAPRLADTPEPLETTNADEESQQVSQDNEKDTASAASSTAFHTNTHTGTDENTGETLTNTPADEDPAQTSTSTHENGDRNASGPDAHTPASSGEANGAAVEDTHATSTEVMELVQETASTSSTSTEAVDNIATSTSASTTSIVSGTSIALANVLNLVNSNFVNSEGVVLFSNFFESVFGAIDFREYFANAASFGCSLVACQGEHVAVNVNNNASIDNEILVTANSGENAIEHAGNGVIQTGDAYAGLNLVNVANTNLVDSNYLLVTLNAFQDMNGDIVFPSLSQFFGSLAGGAASPAAITIGNTASVANSVNVDADAGGNTTHNTGSSAITTGTAIGSSNVFNQLNTSLIGGQSVSIVFRVHGSWAGEIFGAPDSLAWTAGDDGSIYLFDVGGASRNGSLAMNGTSTARINNNVNVIALTGANAITNAETALISTGNAYAGANIINVANANVVGRNWILAVINIFGDFNGNIAFGRPDMWVGGQIDVPASIKNGSELGYKLTVINNGDSPASNVKLRSKTNGDFLKVESASHEYTETSEGLEWSLGTIPAGGAVEVRYTAAVQNTAPGTDIVNTAEVKLRETDNNNSDNREVLAISTDEKKGNGIRLELGKSSNLKQEKSEERAETDLTVQRITQNTSITSTQRTVEQKLIVMNDTNTLARNVVLHDLLKDAEGTVIRDEVWELGDVFPYEEIELGYTITFNEHAALGTYLLSTTMTGGNVEFNSGINGKIVYEQIMLPDTPLLASFASTASVLSPAQESETHSDVYYGKETPLRGPLGTAVAEAATDNQLAAAASAGVPLNPVILFFVAVSALLGFSLLRMYRVF